MEFTAQNLQKGLTETIEVKENFRIALGWSIRKMKDGDLMYSHGGGSVAILRL